MSPQLAKAIKAEILTQARKYCDARKLTVSAKRLKEIFETRYGLVLQSAYTDLMLVQLDQMVDNTLQSCLTDEEWPD